MEVNFYPSKMSNTPNFEAKYPLRDVLCLMSSSEIVGRKSDTFEKTISGILNKKTGIAQEEKVRDYFHARDHLNEKYPQLRELALNFREMLDSVNRNHFAIKGKDVNSLVSRFEEQNGGSFIELV